MDEGEMKLAKIADKLLYPAALLASLSIWLVAVRAPLWLDETLSYWQVSGGFSKIWSRSVQMPSSFAYLYILWFVKSVLGSQEIALRIPSLLAMLAASYFLFRAAQEIFDTEIAFISCILFCLNANVVFAAIDVRPYAFALLMTNLAIFALLRWTARNDMRYAILCGAGAAGILYFQYLFGAILPAFAIYYLALRGRSIRASAGQLAALLSSFALVCAPLIWPFVELFRTRQAHVFENDRRELSVLRTTLFPFKLLIIFAGTVVVAALLRKVKWPGRDCSLAALLCPLLAIVPLAILFGISAATPTHVFIPRYCLVAVPGGALMWGLLIFRIDSRWLRGICCVCLVAITVFEYFSLPSARQHRASFKQAYEFVNADVAKDKAPVLICSAFTESRFEPMPADRTSESALVSQLSYYPVNAPVVLLPVALNDEAIRIGSQAVSAAAQRRQRFLAVGNSGSPVLEWLAGYSRGTFMAQRIADFEGTVVVEFQPLVQ
jgi:mannosyltransferase